MVIYIAAIMTIDEALLEAARIDGANWWQQLFRIKLP
jgi:ABC-type sugar transport system permease subunit